MVLRPNKNDPKYWDSVWKGGVTRAEDLYDITREERSARWPRILDEVITFFGDIKHLDVIEIGAGRGSVAALMAKRGANVTILDYSEAAIFRSREFFLRNGLQGKFVKADVLDLPMEIKKGYDIAMSFGLAEHFSGKEREHVLKAHFDLLKDKGLAVISVPNKFNLPYRLYKWVAEAIGSWPVEEYPFSRGELRGILKKIKVQNYRFLGDSIFESLSWIYSLTYKINPWVVFARIMGKERNYDIKRIRHFKGTFLDEYLSYALILSGRKGE